MLLEVERLLNTANSNKELPKYLLLENVKNLVGKRFKPDFDKWLTKLENLGYTNYWKVLNAKDYGIPQNRERVFVVSILGKYEIYKFPKPKELNFKLKDVLENKVDEKYYLSEKMQDYVLDFNNKQKGTAWEGRVDEEKLNTNIAHTIGVRSAGGSQRAGVSNFVIDGYDGEIKVKDLKMKIKNATLEAPHIVASRGRNPDNPSSRKVGEQLEQRLEANKSGTTNCISTVQKDNYVVENNIKIRKLTPKECWRLMGWKDEQFNKLNNISNTQLYKQAGNGIVINVLEEIFKMLFYKNNE